MNRSYPPKIVYAVLFRSVFGSVPSAAPSWSKLWLPEWSEPMPKNEEACAETTWEQRLQRMKSIFGRPTMLLSSVVQVPSSPLWCSSSLAANRMSLQILLQYILQRNTPRSNSQLCIGIISNNNVIPQTMHFLQTNMLFFAEKSLCTPEVATANEHACSDPTLYTWAVFHFTVMQGAEKRGQIQETNARERPSPEAEHQVGDNKGFLRDKAETNIAWKPPLPLENHDASFDNSMPSRVHRTQTSCSLQETPSGQTPRATRRTCNCWTPHHNLLGIPPPEAKTDSPQEDPVVLRHSFMKAIRTPHLCTYTQTPWALSSQVGETFRLAAQFSDLMFLLETLDKSTGPQENYRNPALVGICHITYIHISW